MDSFDSIFCNVVLSCQLEKYLQVSFTNMGGIWINVNSGRRGDEDPKIKQPGGQGYASGFPKTSFILFGT